MRIIKISILIVALAFIVTILDINNIYDKFQGFLYRKSIDDINLQTMSLFSEEDIIEKIPPPNQEPEDIKQEKILRQTQLSSAEETEPPNIPLIPIPEKALLEVNFICQAPLQTEANWTYHEESCEEAALLQAYLYEKGEQMSKQEAHEEILKMITWQKENFGGHFDLYAKEMSQFIQGYYGLSESEIKVIENAEIEDIKREITDGHPVIVPITGEILKNPYYPYPGYHMLVVTGFNEDRIITNDNGTRRGEDFSYDIKTFETAMKDAGGDIISLRLNNN